MTRIVDRSCGACLGALEARDVFREGDTRVTTVRCLHCGHGGDICRTPDGEVVGTSGPVFEPGRYRQQLGAERTEPAEPLDGPLGDRPVGWEVVTGD